MRCVAVFITLPSMSTESQKKCQNEIRAEYTFPRQADSIELTRPLSRAPESKMLQEECRARLWSSGGCW